VLAGVAFFPAAAGAAAVFPRFRALGGAAAGSFGLFPFNSERKYSTSKSSASGIWFPPIGMLQAATPV
jgi:hypothetical protein